MIARKRHTPFLIEEKYGNAGHGKRSRKLKMTKQLFGQQLQSTTKQTSKKIGQCCFS